MRSHPSLWLTGFGPFEDVESNPSGLLVERLEADPPPAWRVRGLRLPVSFRRAPEAIDRWIDAADGPPSLVIGLGVQKEGTYRFETRARARLANERRRDLDGVVAAEASADAGEEDAELRTTVDLGPLVARLDDAAFPIATSDDAGGYVCERVYHRLLAHARGLRAPCLFLHVPPLAFRPLDEQERFLRHLLDNVEPGASPSS